jgi:mitogen-activated protein kinase 1/3
MSRAAPQSGSRKISFNVSEQYDIQDVVGEGAYGVVCSALFWYVSIAAANPPDFC